MENSIFSFNVDGFPLEIAVTKHDKNIQRLANISLRKSEEILGEGSTIATNMREITCSTIHSKDVIKPLELGMCIYYLHYAVCFCVFKFCIILGGGWQKRQKSCDHKEEGDKSLTEEFVDFMEEVTEEILEVINPDDD